MEFFQPPPQGGGGGKRGLANYRRQGGLPVRVRTQTGADRRKVLKAECPYCT